MKKIIILTVLFIEVFLTKAQNVNYDAAIDIAANKNNYRKKINILLSDKKYKNLSDSDKRIKALKNFSTFLNDPFNNTLDKINYWDIKGELDSNNEKIFTKEEKFESSPIIAPLDGITLPTKIIDASAKFIAERTKQELTIAFFNKFRKQFSDNKLADLFPNTAYLLNSSDYFLMPSMGKMWIGAFKIDLKSLPDNLENVINGDDSINNTEKFKVFSITLKLFNYLELGIHPVDIFSYMANKYSKDSSCISRGITLTNLIAQNLRYNGFEKTWLPFDSLEQMTDDEIKYFVGLIYQNDRHITKLLVNYNVQLNYNKFFNAIKELASILDYNQKIITDMKSDVQLTKDASFALYSKTFYEMLEWGIKQYFVTTPQDANSAYNYLTKIKSIMDNTFKAKNAFEAEDYGMGFLYSMQILKNMDLVNQKLEQRFKDFFTYGSFMVDIISASNYNSDQIAKIIEKYAMPVNSYLVKRNSKRSIDINAYPGFYGGYENESFTVKGGSAVFGITAPVGFSFSMGCKEKSHSLFLSVIDIGAPLSYRLMNDTAQGLPENIKWPQVFSPGLHYVCGFKNSPVSLMLGAQYTPLLRRIENDKNVLNDINTWRFGLTLTIDLPLFNLKRIN